jgi:hypothetical protein
MVGLLILKILGGGIVFAGSLLALAVGVAMVTNRKGLADRFQRHEEGDVIDWPGPVSLRTRYFNFRVVRVYALGLIAWGAFFPSAVISYWLDRRLAWLAGAVALLSLLGMMATVAVMLWHSERARMKLGIPMSGLGRLRSAPFQVSASFCAAIGAGVLVDSVLLIALRSK